MGTEDTNTETELSLRDQIDAAFTESEGTDDPPPAAPASEPANPPTQQTEEAAAPAQSTRDEHGRFTKATQAPAQIGQQQAQQATQTAVQGAQPAAAPEPKAPASWRPEAREKWAGADPTIRAEVTRREHEMQTVLQDSASARQFVQAFESVVRPYEMFIRADGASPLQAVQNLMQTAADLRVGTSQHKAQIVASIIQGYGIDVESLDTILAAMRSGGQIPQAGQQQPYRDPRIDMILAQQQQAQATQAQQAEQQARAELEAFAADPKHEFYRDVSGLMADLVDVQTRQGKPIDLEKIYSQACQMHDSIPTIIATRSQQQKAAGNSQAVLRAKRAAVSVKGDSTLPGATVPANDSIRASIEAAMEHLSDT